MNVSRERGEGEAGETMSAADQQRLAALSIVLVIFAIIPQIPKAYIRGTVSRKNEDKTCTAYRRCPKPKALST